MGALFSQRVATRSSMWRRWVCLARYEANGNVAAIEDANGVVTKASYNAIGQRMSVNDPNQGSWGFAYNALGEVLAQGHKAYKAGVLEHALRRCIGLREWSRSKSCWLRTIS